MRLNTIFGAARAAAWLTLVVASVARAGDDPPRHLGDHPAVIIQRLHQAAGYDYASKFYPHPAWLYLYAAPPQDVAEPATMANTAPAGGDPAPTRAARRSFPPSPSTRRPS